MLRYLFICLTSITIIFSAFCADHPKETPLTFCPEQMSFEERQGAGEDKNGTAISTQPKVISSSGFGLWDREQIHLLMQKNGERKIPSMEVEEFTFFIDVEDTIAHWEHRDHFDWGAYWKNPKMGSDLYNRIKGPMFKQIRVLVQEYGWSKEEAIQRLLRGYFEALANERIVCKETEWAPDFDELVTKIKAKKYNFIFYSHAMITFAAYEAKEFCKKLNEIIAKHNLDAHIEFICGSDLEFFNEIELEVVNRIQELDDPMHNLKDYLEWYENEFKNVKFVCLTDERKDQLRSWDFLFNLLKINVSTSGAALFDNEEKNRAAFLSYLNGTVESKLASIQ